MLLFSDPMVDCLSDLGTRSENGTKKRFTKKTLHNVYCLSVSFVRCLSVLFVRCLSLLFVHCVSVPKAVHCSQQD